MPRSWSLLSDSKAAPTYHMPERQCKPTIIITRYYHNWVAHMARAPSHTLPYLPVFNGIAA